MAVMTEGAAARVPHVPDLAVLVGMARQAGATTEREASSLVRTSLQLLAEQWTDGVRVRVVAAAPVDVARWLVPPRRPSGSVPPGPGMAALTAALAEACGTGLDVAGGTLVAIGRALAEVVPPQARPVGVSPLR